MQNFNRPNNVLPGLAVPLLFVLFQLSDECFTVDARPESDTNRVGESHRITAEVDGSGGDPWLLLFEVFDGPNEGENSLTGCNASDGDCSEEFEEELFTDCEDEITGGDPEEILDCLLENLGLECSPDCLGSGDDSASWSYRGRGGPGTDYIAVCAFNLDIVTDAVRISALAEGSVGITKMIDEALQEEIDFLEEDGCDVVTKTWEDDDEEDSGRFLGGGLFAGDVDAAQRNRERAQASAAVASTPVASTAGVRPPSTGDGGLIE